MRYIASLALCASLLAGNAFAARLYWFVPDGLRADFDGYNIFEEAKKGNLPNIKKLIENGSYGYSVPTYPSHTPCNFATLMTGSYPETHGIPDGPMHIEGFPLKKPSVTGFSSTAKKVAPAWKILEDAGKKVMVVSVPGSTPPETNMGITMRGRWGGWGSDFFAVNYESMLDQKQRAARGNSVKLFYMGPELTKYPALKKAEGWDNIAPSYSEAKEMELNAYGATFYALITDGTNDSAVNYNRVVVSMDKKTVLADFTKENEWSDWKSVTLYWAGKPLPSLVKASLIRVEDNGFTKIRLLFDPLNISTVQPADIAASIEDSVGPMVDFPDNWPAQLNGYPEEKGTFFAEAMMTIDWHRKLAEYVYSTIKPDVMIHDIYTPNQMLESRWWMPYIDKNSLRYNTVTAAERAQVWDEVKQMYKGMDDIIGEMLKKADNDTVIVFSSDHGVIPLNKFLLVNNLLAREGLLKFTVDKKTGEPVVDWKNTRAIHLKMHGIWVHPDGLDGNWKRGSGPEYEKLRARVVKLLKGLKDGNTPVFEKVITNDEAAKLRLPKDRTGDIIMVVKPGYGLNEEMTEAGDVIVPCVEGGYKQALISDDKKGLWTPFVIMGPGIRKNHRIGKNVHNADQLPTILKAVGVQAPEFMTGKVVNEVFEK